MDDSSNKNQQLRDVTPTTTDVKAPVPTPNPAANDIDLFSAREKDVLVKTEKDGIIPIAATRAAQMFELFLEGYTCQAIAKINAPFREGDILYLRKRYEWDRNRDEFTYNLQVQMSTKLAKAKLESLEFITNQMAVVHKEFREKSLKYLQTGKEEDKPEHWISSPAAYKGLLEAMQKITGEDRVTSQNIRSEAKVTLESNVPVTIINPELQTKMLKKLALTEAPKAVEKKDDKE